MQNTSSQSMDTTHSKIGQCEFWDAKPFIDAANILVAADEPLRALELLNLVPGYYRDHADSSLLALKNKIHEKLVTPAWYSKCHDDLLPVEKAEVYTRHLLRGSLVLEEVKKYNERGETPHILELAPGEYWLPMGLQALGCRFTYECVQINPTAYEKAKGIVDMTVAKPSQPIIYCAFEIIEHLHYEQEIRIEMQRRYAKVSQIHVSTPKYTFDGSRAAFDWTKKDLGHLRTYTPFEFFSVVAKMFPEYNFTLYDSQILSLRGEYNGN